MPRSGLSISNGTPSAQVDWTWIQTLSPSAASSATTTGTLPVYDMYMIRGFLIINQAGEANILARINGDTGANYYNTYWNNLTPTTGAGESSVRVGTSRETRRTLFEIKLSGKTPATAGSFITVNGFSGTEGGSSVLIGSEWQGGNAVQVTSLTFLPSASTMTGKIEIFGRNTL